MRISLLLGVIIVLVVLLPIVGLVWGSGWIITAAQIVLSLVLILVIAGTGIFGFICIKAQAKKWGVGLILVAILCILAIFWLWTGRPLLFV